MALPTHCIKGIPSEKSFSLQSSNICSKSQPSICSLFVCNGLFLELLQNHSEKRVTCAGNMSNTYFCCHPGRCLASMSLQDGRWTLCDITNNIFAPSTLLCLFIVCIIRWPDACAGSGWLFHLHRHRGNPSLGLQMNYQITSFKGDVYLH